MNQETDLFFRFFRMRETAELIILTASIKDQIEADKESDEWHGFIHKMNEF